MPYGVDLARLFNVLIGKLRFRQELSGSVQLAPMVVPVIDVGAVLNRFNHSLFNLDLSAGAGTAVGADTVSAGRRWRIMSIWRAGSAANSRVIVRDVDISAGWRRISAAGTAEQVLQPSLLILDEGAQIGMEATGNVGDTSIQLQIIVLEEDMRK